MKIKALSVLIVIALVFLTFVSCKQENANLTSSNASSLDFSNVESSEAEVSDSVSFDTTEREIEFKDYYLSGRFDIDEKDYTIRYAENELKPFVVDDEEALERLFDITVFGTTSKDFFENLPENYFDEYMLLVNDFTNGSLGLYRGVSSVRADESEVTVEYICSSTGNGCQMVDEVIVVVEIKKSDVIGCQSFNAEIDIVDFDTTEREIDFKDYYFTGQFKFDNQDYMIRYAKNELAVFVADGNEDIAVLLSMLEFGGDDVNKFLEELPENYFNEHILLVNDFTNGYLGLRRDVGRVFVDENGVTVEYIYASPEEAADLVEPCVVFVELNKADVFGCQRFNGISYSSSLAYGESE